MRATQAINDEMRAAQLTFQSSQEELDSQSAHVAILDAHGKIVAVNAAWRRFGSDNGQADPDACIGANYLSVCEQAAGAGDSDGLRVARAIRDVLSGRRQEVALAYSCHSPVKSRWFLLAATRFEGLGPGRVMVAHVNITPQQAAVVRYVGDERGEALEANRNRILGLIANNASSETILRAVALLVESQRQDTYCAIVLFRNGRAEVAAAPNFSPSLLAELEGKADWALTGCDTTLSSLLDLAQAVGTEPGENSLRFAPVRAKSGDLIGALVTTSPTGSQAPDDTVIERAAALVSLAVDPARMHERLSFQVQHDSLTELPNWLQFQDQLQQTLFSNRQDREPFAVFVLGLDSFQRVNDVHGYGLGDTLLRQAAQRILGCVRAEDTVARLGGDEFIAILASVDSGRAPERIGRRIIEAFRTPFTIGKQSIQLTCSVGISLYPQDATEPGTLVRKASEALAGAKRSGKNSWMRFDSQPDPSACERTEIERYLRDASQSGELELEYQPQVDRQRRIVGLEALMRWNSPVLGRVSPTEFIPIAEQSGLIVEMGVWALRRACRQCVEWQTAGLSGVSVAVNVSTIQLAKPDFVPVVAAVLAETGMNPHLLELEITESGMIQAMDDAIRKMRELRQLGIRISVDDFGAGYASLRYIENLPIDTIKIDRSLIQPLNGDSRSAESLVQAIIALAHNLKLKVVAEGIETEAQFAALGALRCDVIQGFLLHRPLSVRNVERLLLPAAVSIEIDALVQ